MAKSLLFLRVTEGRCGEVLESLAAVAPEIFSRYPDRHATIRVMATLIEDPLANRKAPDHAADITIELKTSPGLPLSDLATAWSKVLDNKFIDRSNSLALLMHERQFRPSPPQPICYHYLMIRQDGFKPADYHDYYVNYHSHFGMITPGIEGYSQNYIDQNGSRELALALGLGYREVSSISEMHIANMEEFMSSPAMAEIGPDAAADEARFVNQGASIMFSSSVELSLGDPLAVLQSAFTI